MPGNWPHHTCLLWKFQSPYIIQDIYKFVLHCFCELSFADDSANSVYTYRGFYGKCKGPVPDQRFARRGRRFDFASSVRTFTHFGNAAHPQLCWNCGFACVLSFVCSHACAFNVCSHIRALTCVFRCVRLCALYACFPCLYACVRSTCPFNVCSHVRALTCMSSMYAYVSAWACARCVLQRVSLLTQLCALICMLSMRAIEWRVCFHWCALNLCALHTRILTYVSHRQNQLFRPGTKYKLSGLGGPIALLCFVHINTKRGTNAAELISRIQISINFGVENLFAFLFGRLRTVANGCEHKSSVARTRLHPQNPKVKREPFATHSGKYDILSGWWYTYPSEKYESQLGLLFPIYGKIYLKKSSKPPASYYIDSLHF